ncbi:MAG TPA: glucosaminidase domain-containing protein [Flavobacterium sp.]|jgi:flagellum-specific peptidoglycan hydrolase FlgJ
MTRKLCLLLILIILASCGGNKRVASKRGYKKPATTVRTVRKPATRKPVASAPVNRPESETLEATSKVKVTTELVLDYIDEFKDTAKRNMKQYGIPSSIIIAQGILESGSGTAALSVQANNHFGIKCHKEWTGPSVSHDDDSAGECFRKYADASESYRDHALFLTSRPRYDFLFDFDKDDYKAWAHGLRQAGYATDPKYPDKLISLIERYQLYKYDAEAMGTPFIPANTNEAITSSDLYLVSKGDTLYSISKRFNISLEELRRKNNIIENSISIGQLLKIR